MKKIISILSAISLSSITTSSLISCGDYADTNTTVVRLQGIESVFSNLLIDTNSYEIDADDIVTKEVFENVIGDILGEIVDGANSSDVKITYYDSSDKESQFPTDLKIDDKDSTINFKVSSNSSKTSGETGIISSSVWSYNSSSIDDEL